MIYTVATIVSIILPIIVFVLSRVSYPVIPTPEAYILPKINAYLNGGSAVLLVLALVFVKRNNIKGHTLAIYGAMILSLVFLICYVLYHLSTQPTPYGGEGAMKTVYYVLLITHIILAGIQAPFVLFAFAHAYTGQYQKHKKLVKLAFPIWLYVSITGVICYIMLAPYYPV